MGPKVEKRAMQVAIVVATLTISIILDLEHGVLLVAVKQAAGMMTIAEMTKAIPLTQMKVMIIAIDQNEMLNLYEGQIDLALFWFLEIALMH